MDSSEVLVHALDIIDDELLLYHDYVSDRLIKAFSYLSQAFMNSEPQIKEFVSEQLHQRVPKGRIFFSTWFYSFLIQFYPKPDFFEEACICATESNVLTANNKFFLYYQYKGFLFNHPDLESANTVTALWQLHRQTVRDFMNLMPDKLAPIPVEERKSQSAVIITEQFLSLQHGPTKTALDKCYALIHGMGKQVLLINTTEVYSQTGSIPFFIRFTGTTHSEIQDAPGIEWNGLSIPYYQCQSAMPDLTLLQQLIDEIRFISPSIVLSIGGSSILTSLVNQLVPAMTFGLTSSGLDVSETDYQLCGPLNNTFRQVIHNLHIQKDQLIPGVLTYVLKEQTEHHTRSELGLPESSLLLFVVGARLDIEITDEFLTHIGGVLCEDIHLVLIGKMDTYEKVIQKHKEVEPFIHNLGYCYDILSHIEICDLYLNPNRKGGGTSCVESLAKGIPVLTTKFGDVYGIVGDDFACDSYSEMVDEIRHYENDSTYYCSQSKKGQQLVAPLLDSEAESVRQIQEYLNRSRS